MEPDAATETVRDSSRVIILFRHSYFRGIVLGLMLFLAGTAFCSRDAYDPDPYDDIPPVVTVEFNYVVPGQANVQVSHSALCKGVKMAGAVQQQMRQPADLLPVNQAEMTSALLHTPPQMFVPLRR